MTLPTPNVAAALRARAKTYTADGRQLQRMAALAAIADWRPPS